MNEKRRIGVFFSKGRTLADALKAVRRYDANAQLCAIVPAAYAVSDDERSLADEVMETGKLRYGIRDMPAFIELVKELRAARFDSFVVLFDTPRQRVLASAVNAPQRFYCRLDGKVVEIDYTIPGVIADALRRAIYGRTAYALLWLIVRVLKTRSPFVLSQKEAKKTR